MKSMGQVHNGVRFPVPWTQRIGTPVRRAKASNVVKASQ